MPWVTRRSTRTRGSVSAKSLHEMKRNAFTRGVRRGRICKVCSVASWPFKLQASTIIPDNILVSPRRSRAHRESNEFEILKLLMTVQSKPEHWYVISFLDSFHTKSAQPWVINILPCPKWTVLRINQPSGKFAQVCRGLIKTNTVSLTGKSSLTTFLSTRSFA